MATLYKYQTQGGREVLWVDGEEAYQPEDIRRHWAETFPELSNAQPETSEGEQVVEVEGVAQTVARVVTFVKKVGTKGAKAKAKAEAEGSTAFFRLYDDDRGERVYLGEDLETMVQRRQARVFQREVGDDWAAYTDFQREYVGEDEALLLLGAEMLPGFEKYE